MTCSLTSGKEFFIIDGPKYEQQIFRLDQHVIMSTEQRMLAEIFWLVFQKRNNLVLPLQFPVVLACDISVLKEI